MSFIIPVIQVVGTVLAAKTAIEGIQEGNLFKAVLGGVGAYMGFSSLAAGAASAGAEAGAAGSIAEGSVTGTALDPVAASAGNAVTNTSALESLAQAANAGDAGFVFGTQGGAGAMGSLADAGMGALGDAGIGALQAGGAGAAGGLSALEAVGGAGASVYDAALQAAGQDLGGLVAGPSGGGWLDKLVGAENASALRSLGGELKDSLGGIGDQLGKVSDFAKENGALLQVAGQGLSGYAQTRSEEEQLRRVLEEKRRLAEEERRRRGGAVDIGLSGYRYDPMRRQLVPAGVA